MHVERVLLQRSVEGSKLMVRIIRMRAERLAVTRAATLWREVNPMSDYPDHWKEFERNLFRLTGKSYGATPEPSTPQHIVMGRIPDASSSARVTGPCGETIEIYLKVRNQRVEKASFCTDGCGASVLCGYVAALLAKGKTIDEAAEIGGDTILNVLGNLPKDHHHCATLAAETLRVAIHNYLAKPQFREHLADPGRG